MSSPRVLITGASSGIGAALAQEAARRGWSVTGIGRDAAVLERLSRALPGHGHSFVIADLLDPADLQRICHDLRSTSGQVQLVINAAGMGVAGAFPLTEMADELAMMDLNIRVMLAVCHAAAASLPEGGAIINVCSTAAYWSTGTYAASKAWVLAMTRGLDIQLRPSGRTAMALVPGFTRTAFHQRSRTNATHVASWLWLQPQQVASRCFSDLARGRKVSIPGLRYRILLGVLWPMPMKSRRWVLQRIAPLSTSPAQRMDHAGDD